MLCTYFLKISSTKLQKRSVPNKYVYNIHFKITWMEYSEMLDPQHLLASYASPYFLMKCYHGYRNSLLHGLLPYTVLEKNCIFWHTRLPFSV